MTTRWWIVAPALLLLTACAQTDAPHGHAQTATDGRPVLYDSLGDYSHRITTANPVISC